MQNERSAEIMSLPHTDLTDNKTPDRIPSENKPEGNMSV